jgi:superfamily I DNA/RNA helicase
VTGPHLGDSDGELCRAVMREALALVTAEERALLRVALTRADNNTDKDTERMLRLLLHYDSGRTSALPPGDRWALASALRMLRGLSWLGSFAAAQVHESTPTTSGA